MLIVLVMGLKEQGQGSRVTSDVSYVSHGTKNTGAGEQGYILC